MLLEKENNLSLSGQIKQRDDSIDIVRGICIFLMVVGHVGFGGLFDHYIHAFHVPVFFVVSGMFYKSSQPFVKYLIKKLKTLIVPYLFVGTISLIVWKLVNISDWSNWQPALHHICDNSTGMPFNGALWFLTAMFWTALLYWVIDVLFTKRVSRVVAVCLIFCLGILQKYLPFRFPLQIGVSLTAILFMELGRVLKDLVPYIASIRIGRMFACVVWAFAFLLVSILILLNDYVNVRMGIYAIEVVTVFNVFVMTILLILFARFLQSKSLAIVKACCRWLKSIGRYSIIYLCFNELLIRLIEIAFEGLLGTNPLVQLAFKLIVSVVVFGVLSGLVVLTKKIRLRKIFNI